MHVAAVLKRKGNRVVSIAPDRTIAEAVSLLTNHGIGAVLVLDTTGNIHGILSERDIVNGVSGHGADVLAQRRAFIDMSRGGKEFVASHADQCSDLRHVRWDAVLDERTSLRFRMSTIAIDERSVDVEHDGSVWDRRDHSATSSSDG